MPNMENSDRNNDAGEMIVKRVSVPVGLEELMEGLAKEVLLNKPDDIYLFAAKYFSKLLLLRDKGNYKVKTIRSAQTVAEHNRRWTEKKCLTQDTPKTVQRQFSIRTESPKKHAATKIPQTGRENQREKPQVKKEAPEKPSAKPEQLTMEGKQKYMYSKSAYRNISNERPKNTHHRERSQSSTDRAKIVKPVTDQKKIMAGKRGKIRSLSTDDKRSPRANESNKPKNEIKAINNDAKKDPKELAAKQPEIVDKIQRSISRKSSAVKSIVSSVSNIMKTQETEAPYTDEFDTNKPALDIEETISRSELLHTVLSQDSLDDASKTDTPSRAEIEKGSATPQTLIAEITSKQTAEDTNVPSFNLDSKTENSPVEINAAETIQLSETKQNENNSSYNIEVKNDIAEDKAHIIDDGKMTLELNITNKSSEIRAGAISSGSQSQSENSSEANNKSLTSDVDSKEQTEDKISVKTNLEEATKTPNVNTTEDLKETPSFKVDLKEQLETKEASKILNEDKENATTTHEVEDQLERISSCESLAVESNDKFEETEEVKSSIGSNISNKDSCVETQQKNPITEVDDKANMESKNSIAEEAAVVEKEKNLITDEDKLNSGRLSEKSIVEGVTLAEKEDIPTGDDDKLNTDSLGNEFTTGDGTEGNKDKILITYDDKSNMENPFEKSNADDAPVVEKVFEEEQIESKVAQVIETSEENDNKNERESQASNNNKVQSEELSKESNVVSTDESSVDNDTNKSSSRNTSHSTNTEQKNTEYVDETKGETKLSKSGETSPRDIHNANSENLNNDHNKETKVESNNGTELEELQISLNDNNNVKDTENTNESTEESTKIEEHLSEVITGNIPNNDNKNVEKILGNKEGSQEPDLASTKSPGTLKEDDETRESKKPPNSQDEDVSEATESKLNISKSEEKLNHKIANASNGSINETRESQKVLSNRVESSNSTSSSKEEQNKSPKLTDDGVDHIVTIDKSNNSANISSKDKEQTEEDINRNCDIEETTDDKSLANNQNALEKGELDASSHHESLKTQKVASNPKISAVNSINKSINQNESVSEVQTPSSEKEPTLSSADSHKEEVSSDRKTNENIDATDTIHTIKNELSAAHIKSLTNAFIESQKYGIKDDKQESETSIQISKEKLILGGVEDAKSNNDSILTENTDKSNSNNDVNSNSSECITENAVTKTENEIAVTSDKKENKNHSSKKPDIKSSEEQTTNKIVEQENKAKITISNSNKEKSECNKQIDKITFAEENEVTETECIKESSTTPLQNDKKTNADLNEFDDHPTKKVIFYDGNGEIIVVGKHNSQKSSEKIRDKSKETIENDSVIPEKENEALKDQKVGRPKNEGVNENHTSDTTDVVITSEESGKNETIEKEDSFSGKIKTDEQAASLATTMERTVSNIPEHDLNTEGSVTKANNTNVSLNEDHIKTTEVILSLKTDETKDQKVDSKLSEIEFTREVNTTKEDTTNDTNHSYDIPKSDEQLHSSENYKILEAKGSSNISQVEQKLEDETIKKEANTSITSNRTTDHPEAKQEPAEISSVEIGLGQIEEELVKKISPILNDAKPEEPSSKADKDATEHVTSEESHVQATANTNINKEDNTCLKHEEANDSFKATSAFDETVLGNNDSNTSEIKDSAKENANREHLEYDTVEKEDDSDLKSLGNESINNEDTINEVPSLTETSKTDTLVKSGSCLSNENEDEEVAKKILGEKLLKELSLKSSNSDGDNSESNNPTESHQERKKRSLIAKPDVNGPAKSLEHNTKGGKEVETNQILSENEKAQQSIENIALEDIKNNDCSTETSCGHTSDAKVTENATFAKEDKNSGKKLPDDKNEQNISPHVVQSPVTSSHDVPKCETKTQNHCDSIDDPNNCDSNNNTKTIIETLGTSITDATIATASQTTTSMDTASNKSVANSPDLLKKSTSLETEQTKSFETKNSNQKTPHDESVDMEAIDATIQTLKTGVLNRVVKNYINNFINREKHINNVCEQERFPPVPSESPEISNNTTIAVGSKETTNENVQIGNETNKTSRKISEKNDRQNDNTEKDGEAGGAQMDEQFVANPPVCHQKTIEEQNELISKCDNALSILHNVKSSPDVDKLPQTTEDRITTTHEHILPNGFNSYKLNGHIKHLDENQDSEKQGYGTKMLNKAMAVQKIQSMWRGFIVRKNLNLFNSNDRSKFFYSHSSLPNTDLKMKEMKKNVENIVQAKIDADEKQKKIERTKSRENSAKQKTIESARSLETPNRPKSIESTDSAVTVIHTEEPEVHEDVQNKIDPDEDCSQLSNNIDEIDAIQNKLLDQIAGKAIANDDTKIDSLLATTNFNDIKYEDDMDLDITPPATDLKEDKSGNLSPIEEQLEVSRDRDGRISGRSIVEGRVSEGLEQNAAGSPRLSESLEHLGKSKSLDVQMLSRSSEPKKIAEPLTESALETVKDEDSKKFKRQNNNDDTSSVCNQKLSQKPMSHLLHTGELHDTVIIPVEITKDSDKSSVETDEMTRKSVKVLESNKSEGLMHTGELHDMVGLPLEALGVKTEKEELIDEVEKNAAKMRKASEEMYASTGLKHTGELHDSLPQVSSVSGNENGDSKERKN